MVTCLHVILIVIFLLAAYNAFKEQQKTKKFHGPKGHPELIQPPSFIGA
jgi:hypothetical protein